MELKEGVAIKGIYGKYSGWKGVLAKQVNETLCYVQWEDEGDYQVVRYSHIAVSQDPQEFWQCMWILREIDDDGDVVDTATADHLVDLLRDSGDRDYLVALFSNQLLPSGNEVTLCLTTWNDGLPFSSNINAYARQSTVTMSMVALGFDWALPKYYDGHSQRLVQEQYQTELADAVEALKVEIALNRQGVYTEQMFKCVCCGERYKASFCADKDVRYCRYCGGDQHWDEE